MKYSSILMFFKMVPLKRIVIIGHMRSGSTLLAHILVSNPEIIGIGEMHNVYRNENFHTKMMASVLAKKRAFRFNKNIKYVMDKILHPYILNDAILKDEATRIILLVRSPEETIPSILHLYESENKTYTCKDAFEHYIERLNFILDTKAKYESRCFFIDYADFLENNKNILERLNTFLQLTKPFTSKYKVTEFTGKWGRGDTSNNIASGKILSGTEKNKSSGEFINLDNALLDKARTVYNSV